MNLKKNYVRVKNRIAEFRLRKGLRQIDLAEALGVSSTTIKNWECGICEPSPASGVKIAAYFEVPWDDIFKFVYNEFK